MKNIYSEIKQERKLQNKKWGEQNHQPIEWIGILTEEVGEASKEAVDHHFKNSFKDGGEIFPCSDLIQTQRLRAYRKEVIQVAAVAVHMVESLDRMHKHL